MKHYKPTSNGRRNMTGIEYRKLLSTQTPEKSLTKGGKRDVGRNNAGRITTRHHGGGHKRRFRDVDFLMEKRDIPAKVATVEYDPNRSGFIGVVVYADGAKRYMLLPQQVKVGDAIVVSDKAPIKPGNRLPLKNIPVGTYIYNVELRPQGGAKLIRSAGSYAEVVAHDEGYAQIKMPSTEIRKVLDTAWASVGAVSNDEHYLVNIGKAGRARWKGIRPTVRGSAMNPVDHPHGGGEGRQGIGLRRGPKTREGKLAYGVKTRTPKKYSNKLIVSRRKTKRNK
jgi:large subunit ribosomal protein L2